MQSFQFASQVSRQGMLNLQLPPDFANQEVDIVLVINTKKKSQSARASNRSVCRKNEDE